jgi:SAM-dependent methyltransferase
VSDPSPPTAEARRLWDGAAATYDEAIAPALSDAQRAVLGLLGDLDGREVLDLGCGTGRVGELAARRGARVTAVDLSPNMVAIASARLASFGARVEVMDAQALELPDASFDAVVASFSLMFCPEPERALAEARRVLRPGGALAVSVWGLPEECDTARIGRVAAAFAVGPAPEIPTGQALGDPVRLEALVRDAGFGEVELRSGVARLRYPGPDACWRAVLHVHGARIPESSLAAAEAATRAEIARVGLPLSNRMWLVRASA